jgi:hypothetical protein
MRRSAVLLLLAFAAAACTDRTPEEPQPVASPGRARALAAMRDEPLPAECHPAYWPCVPRATDVDCFGRGDGPEYVQGPIEIITRDPYGLDDDDDGIGCET